MSALGDKILNRLEEKRGEYVSDDLLAAELKITRAYVCKLVFDLQEDCKISTSAKRGFMLDSDADALTAEIVTNKLDSDFFDISVYPKLDSTNTKLKSLAVDEKEGKVIIARAQTAGRGRTGRSFFSDNGGVYMSILLKPDFGSENVNITALAAVAVSEAIESIFGGYASIKWVNDVFYNEKKVCGILTEGEINSENGTFDYIIVGIGINVRKPRNGFPKDIISTAGALTEGERGGNLRAELIATVLNRFHFYYKNYHSRAFIDAYRSRSFLQGKTVTVERGTDRISGVVKEIDKECRLVLDTDNGIKVFSSGEVVKVCL